MTDTLHNPQGRPAFETGSLLELLPDATEAEQFEMLVAQGNVRIERIVSRGQITPPGVWYNQQHNEWVLLLAGSTLLQFEGDDEFHRLEVGQWLLLPAHCRHRVAWVPPEEITIWLAVHWPYPETESREDIQHAADIG